MRHLDLFSGIGGFALAARWAGIETVGFCEIEEFPRKVLQKNFPNVPIHHDIKELDGSEYAGIDIITGGYPCQPFSVAGSQKAQEDPRHLWPQMFRVIKQARPTWIVCENVAGHIALGLDTVLSDMEGEGYTTRTFNIPAIGKDARHKRERIWMVGYTEHNGRITEQKLRSNAETSNQWREEKQEKAGQFKGASRPVDVLGIQGGHSNNEPRPRDLKINTKGKRNHNFQHWKVEPSVDRMVDGLPDQLDRIRGLGNAIVPQVAYEIMRCLKAV